jgi:hypothetical protein
MVVTADHLLGVQQDVDGVQYARAFRSAHGTRLPEPCTTTA